jgi:hypothetical protein
MTPAPPPNPTALKCQACHQAGAVVLETAEDKGGAGADVIMLHCHACGARWSWLMARSCKH